MNIFFISMQSTDPGLLESEPKQLQVKEGIAIEQALEHIGIASEQIPQLIQARAIAVFGVTAIPGQILYANDRIELLDQLRFDPMESRRRRAEHSKKRKDVAKQRSKRATPT